MIVQQILRDGRHHVMKGWVEGTEVQFPSLRILPGRRGERRSVTLSNLSLKDIRQIVKSGEQGVKVCAYGGLALARGHYRNHTPLSTMVSQSPGFMEAVILLAMAIDPDRAEQRIAGVKRERKRVAARDHREDPHSLREEIVDELDAIITNFNDLQTEAEPVLGKFAIAIDLAEALGI